MEVINRILLPTFAMFLSAFKNTKIKEPGFQRHWKSKNEGEKNDRNTKLLHILPVSHYSLSAADDNKGS